MTTTINASPTNGLVQTADGSGVLKVQSNGVTTNALAWVNFNGTNGSIRASYNVSSVTRTSTGYYTVNFANATTDANYSPVAWCSGTGAAGPIYVGAFANYAVTNTITTPTTSGFVMSAYSSTGSSNYDPTYVSVSVFGN